MKEISLWDRVVDALFGMKKETLMILGIIALGFILRLIAAVNLSVSADDMHHTLHAVNFLSSGRLETYDQSAGLWHAFTSVMYNIFGISQLSSRLAALIFGTFTILVIYLLSMEFFDKRTSIIAAFLLAVAPFHIKSTIAEMDIMAMFFAMSAALYFIKGIKSERKSLFFISGIFLGLSIYTKVYPILFIPSLLIFFAVWQKKNKKAIFTKNNSKLILTFLLSAFVFTIPALTHNILLYKDKGFMDLQFTRTLGLGKEISAQYYSWDVQFDAKNDWVGLFFGNSKNSGSDYPTLLTTTGFILRGDPLNFILGIAGILLILFYKKERKDYIIFSSLMACFALLFLSAIIILPKHYLFLDLLLIPAAAFSLSIVADRISKHNIKLKHILLAVLLFTLVFVGIPNPSDITHFYAKSHISQMINFKDSSIPKTALIVADNRIYTGRANWAFQGRPYLEGTDFMSVLQQQQQQESALKNELIPIDVYFFECAIDDCGWGTIKNQKELNDSMEYLVSLFSQRAPVAQFYEPSDEHSYYPIISSDKKEVIVNVYKAKVPLVPSVLNLANKPKNWFLYDIGYEPKEKQFDSYQSYGYYNILDRLAHLIVWLALLLAFISLIYLAYQVKHEIINNNSSI